GAVDRGEDLELRGLRGLRSAGAGRVRLAVGLGGARRLRGGALALQGRRDLLAAALVQREEGDATSDHQHHRADAAQRHQRQRPGPLGAGAVTVRAGRTGRPGWPGGPPRPGRTSEVACRGADRVPAVGISTAARSGAAEGLRGEAVPLRRPRAVAAHPRTRHPDSPLSSIRRFPRHVPRRISGPAGEGAGGTARYELETRAVGRRGLTRSRTRVRLRVMRWSGQEIGREVAAEQRAPALLGLSGLVRSVRTPQFHGVTFHEVTAKSALNRVPAASSMPFGWTVNPYRGCSHACVYCFARSSHRYLELDAGADFDQQVIVKINVAEVLRAELAKRSWQRSLVALGTNTDPYQRAE